MFADPSCDKPVHFLSISSLPSALKSRLQLCNELDNHAEEPVALSGDVLDSDQPPASIHLDAFGPYTQYAEPYVISDKSVSLGSLRQESGQHWAQSIEFASFENSVACPIPRCELCASPLAVARNVSPRGVHAVGYDLCTFCIGQAVTATSCAASYHAESSGVQGRPEPFVVGIIPGPYPCASLNAEGPNLNSNLILESSGLDLRQPRFSAGVCSQDLPGPELCACGSGKVLGALHVPEVQAFVRACGNVAENNPGTEVRLAVHQLNNFCQWCILAWHAGASKAKGGALPLGRPCPDLSGPRFFGAEFLSSDFGGPRLGSQVDVEAPAVPTSAVIAQRPFNQGSAPMSLSQPPQSRRARRRWHRRRRLAEGAPSTQEEDEAFAMKWSLCEELVGSLARGPGGPGAGTKAPACSADGAQVHKLAEVQPDVRPAGCARKMAQQTALLNVKQAVLSQDEGALLDAVEVMEQQGLMQEGTFVWRAAELAIETQAGDVPRSVACWAIDDALSNLSTPKLRADLHVISANITSWRKDLCPWIAQHKASILLLQETHLSPEQPDLIDAQLGFHGYGVFSIPGHPTGKGGTSGGLAICFRKHLNLRCVHHFVKAGAGYQVAALRLKDADCYFVNVYLKAGEGFQGSLNAQILASLIPFLRSVRGLYTLTNKHGPPEMVARRKGHVSVQNRKLC